MPHKNLMSRRLCTWPQFCRRESVAARRLYQGILLFTWCGTCTLMSWHRNSTLQSQRIPSVRPAQRQQLFATFNSPPIHASRSTGDAHPSDSVDTPRIIRLTHNLAKLLHNINFYNDMHSWRMQLTVRTSVGSHSALFLRAVPSQHSTRQRA